MRIFQKYAQYYDVFYRFKDYRKECDYLEGLFEKYSRQRPKTILDLGCGTGGYTFPLVQKGYQLTAIDASLPMLRKAEEKQNALHTRIRFYQKNLQDFQLKRKFDVVVCMFSVIDYLIKDKDIAKALKNIRGHMKKDSLFIFDFWNQEAVERFYTPKKRKAFSFNDKVIERSSRTRILPQKRLCEVNYTCRLKEKGDFLKGFRERHVVRYFSKEEISEILQGNGFEILDIHPFLHMNGGLKKNTWDVTVVAKKMS